MSSARMETGTLLAAIRSLPPQERLRLVEQVLHEVRWPEAAVDRPVPMEALMERTPGVVGGSTRVARTRIPVWTLENCRRLGMSADDVVAAFPSLRVVDVQAAWACAEAHREEVEQDIRENDAA
jgi:uncharacterized protein (DUF433 family)